MRYDLRVGIAWFSLSCDTFCLLLSPGSTVLDPRAGFFCFVLVFWFFVCGVVVGVGGGWYI